MVLFENLWWPGLRLLNKKTVELFFNPINRKNVGIMLDTGHLLNINDKLNSQQQAVDYIYKVILHLGSEAARIKGIHLSCSLSGNYQHYFKHTVPKNINCRILLNHIISICRLQVRLYGKYLICCSLSMLFTN
ncbi:sugar phosphate isomerase/epimerase [Pectinatus frisingensis]|uniref:sugar phosphate isomerase/epimerase n=1 Tax=Pectinatus frisingensis TaxID=865 RepID=UPI001E57B5AF